MMIRPNIRGIQIEPASSLGPSGVKVRVSDVESLDLNVKQVEFRGVIPLERDLCFGEIVTSLFDCTGGRLLPIQCDFPEFQEEETSAFQMTYDIGEIGGSLEFQEWTCIGLISPMFINGPFEDTRNLMVVTRLVDLDLEYEIRHGQVISHDGVFWTGIKKFKLDLFDDGYLESQIRLHKFHFTSINLAVLTAAKCGHIQTQTIEVIQEKMDNWLDEADSLDKIYDGYRNSQERSEKYSRQLDQALQKAKNKTLRPSRFLTELKQRCSPAQATELIQFCFDVIMTNQTITAPALELIDNIAKTTRIDTKELEKIRDDRIIKVGTGSDFDIPAEQFLGINPYWKPHKKIKHLESEFHKWNSRLNLVRDEDTRENIQRMLNMIGDALRKYR